MAYNKNFQPTKAASFNTYPGGPAIESPTHLREIDLTAAQIIAMGTTPVAILPAPSSTKAILVTGILIRMTRTSTAFTGGGVVTFQYHTTTTSVPHAGSMAASIVTTGGAGSANIWLGPNVGTSGLVIPAGEGIDITNATAAFAAGTGTMKVFIQYRVIQVS